MRNKHTDITTQMSEAVRQHIDSIEALHTELNAQIGACEELRARLAETIQDGQVKDREINMLTRVVDVERLNRRHFERLSDQLMTQLNTVRTLIDDVFKKVEDGMRRKEIKEEEINGQDKPVPAFLLKGPANDQTS